MAITARNLTLRANPKGVERYVAELSTERSKVHERQNSHEAQTQPEKNYTRKRKINMIDMEKGVARFNYGRNVDFIEIDRTEWMLEENGYEIVSAFFTFNRESGATYTINFEPMDLAA